VFPAAMGVLLTLITGLVVWIVLWALGWRAFDAVLITALLLVIAAAVRLVVPYLPGNRRDF
jgi:hypothetical protein